MKAPWVFLVASATLVIGLVTGGFAGFAFGLWTGRESVSGSASSGGAPHEELLPIPEAARPTAEPLPRLELEVHTDGCGVIRSEAAPGVRYQTLTWVFRDRDGFQVLGRAAESETRYRYFLPGEYTVVLEAHDGERYQPVSNEVTVTC